MSFSEELAREFRRDLLRLRQQIGAFPDDATLWQVLPGVTNSAGNLILHLEGNLREYIGRQLGGISFTRNRPLEFSASGVSRAELDARLMQVADQLSAVIAGLSPEQMEREYPEVVLAGPLSTGEFLLHLYGHMNWHFGQVDYLRRILTGQGALVETVA
jgi:hypothetical protein